MSQATMAMALPVKYQAIYPIPRVLEDPCLEVAPGGHKILLAQVQADLKYCESDSELIRYTKSQYLPWVRQDSYLVMARYSVNGYEGHVAVKASKRGNDVYHKRVTERLSELYELPEVDFFDYKDRSSRHSTQACFITLTYARKYCVGCGLGHEVKAQICSECGSNLVFLSVAEAWDKVSEDYNRYTSWLRGKYGPVSIFRVFEAQSKEEGGYPGYPHIHMVALFAEAEFGAFHHSGAWRVHQKDQLAEGWPHGFTDIEAVASTKGGLNYLVKYLGKLHELDSPAYEAAPGEGNEDSNLAKLVSKGSVTTLALLWVFNKRAFAVSGAWGEFIEALHNSNADLKTVLVQADLLGNAEGPTWVLLGFFTGELRVGGHKRWSVALDPGDYRKIAESGCWSRRGEINYA